MLLDITALHFITLSSLPGRITLKYRCMLMRALKSACFTQHTSSALQQTEHVHQHGVCPPQVLLLLFSFPPFLSSPPTAPPPTA